MLKFLAPELIFGGFWPLPSDRDIHLYYKPNKPMLMLLDTSLKYDFEAQAFLTGWALEKWNEVNTKHRWLLVGRFKYAVTLSELNYLPRQIKLLPPPDRDRELPVFGTLSDETPTVDLRNILSF